MDGGGQAIVALIDYEDHGVLGALDGVLDGALDTLDILGGGDNDFETGHHNAAVPLHSRSVRLWVVQKSVVVCGYLVLERLFERTR